jgi:hypothetical protein
MRCCCCAPAAAVVLRRDGAGTLALLELPRVLLVVLLWYWCVNLSYSLC